MQGPGEFLAEVEQLSGKPALVDARANGEVEALLVEPEHLRALLVAEAEVGELIMRALILRRGYYPPEGWGWCFVDHVGLDLGDDTTPQDRPIPRYY